MNKELLKTINIRIALCWAAAMVLPVIVMIVLDLFDLHTPARVALLASISIIVPFQIAHRYLGQELGRLIPEADNRA